MVYGKNNEQTCDVHHRDAGEAVRIIVHENFSNPDFVREAKVVVHPTDGRIYNDPQTGKWWNEVQVQIIHHNRLLLLFFFL